MASAQDEFDELMRDKSHRTGHPEDDIDDISSHDPSDDEDNSNSPVSRADSEEPSYRPGMSNARIPTTRYQANTGPKGVISDAQDWRDSLHDHRSSIRNLTLFASQSQPPSLEAGLGAPKWTDLDEEDEDDVDDDEFIKHWRESRIQELQNGSRDDRIVQNGRNNRRYGGLTTVDQNGYLDAVDKAPQDAVIVVYVYDDQSDVSGELEDCIRVLASKHVETRFVKLHYEDALIERTGVPALIAYRGGDSFAQLVPMIDELPDDADLSAITVESVLKK